MHQNSAGGGYEIFENKTRSEEPISSGFLSDLEQHFTPDVSTSTAEATAVAPTDSSEIASKMCTESQSITNSGVDLGFRVFKVDESSFIDHSRTLEEYTQTLSFALEESIKSERSALDLLFECVLMWRMPLHCPYSEESIGDYRVYSYNHGDLMACFASEIHEDLVYALAERNVRPLRLVLCDSSFKSSSDKINFCELFAHLLPEVELRVL